MEPEERKAMITGMLAEIVAEAKRAAVAEERAAVVKAIKDLLWDQPTDNFEMRRNEILKLAIQVVAARQ